jgi:alpha-L-fucosidase 2
VYPIFPGHEIHSDNQPELFQAFKTAVEKRLIIGLGDQSNWSLVHLASIYARLEDGNRALECLELLTRSCVLNNLYTVANDWRNMGICIPFKTAPFQIDGNIGLTNAVQEMLLYVSPGLIKILPACPEKWNKGRVERLRFCTGRISFAWDWEQGQFQAALTAERDTDVTLKLPVQLEEYRWQEAGREAQMISRAKHGRKIRLAAGRQLNISATRPG